MDRRAWNPLYTLHWTTLTGPHHLTGTARDIHSHAPRIHQLGDQEATWDIAVHNNSGSDVTGRFFNHLDHTP